MDPAPARKPLKSLFFPAAALGIVAIAVALAFQDTPEKVPPGEVARPVRIISVPKVDVVPRAVGYGTVQPSKVWEAVAEIAGRIVFIHPHLKKGSILAQGTVILRIDPEDYEIALREAEANLRSAQAELAELAVKEENTRLQIEIEKRSVKLSEANLARKKKLLARGNASQAAVDEEERLVLAERQSLQSHRNTLNLVPSERQALEAKVALYQAKIEESKRDLERTEIELPFDARIAEVHVETAQYVTQGKVMAIGDSIEVAEVTAQFAISRFIHLLGEGGRLQVRAADIMEDMPRLLGLEPTVRLHTGDVHVDWPARFTRIADAIDPQTRTVGVIVAVDDPYKQVEPGVRPPLVKNMYVEVELRGKILRDRVVVPRSAIHAGRVYVLNGDDRLAIRPVESAFDQTNFSVIAAGVEPGDRLVVSDLVPAIEGQLLSPTVDAEALGTLEAEARGEGSVR